MANAPTQGANPANPARGASGFPKFKKRSAEEMAAAASEPETAAQLLQAQQPQLFPSASSRAAHPVQSSSGSNLPPPVSSQPPRTPKHIPDTRLSLPSSQHSSCQTESSLPLPESHSQRLSLTPAASSSPRKIPAGYKKAVRLPDAIMLAYGTLYIAPDMREQRMGGGIFPDSRWGPFDYIFHPGPYDHSAPHLAFSRLADTLHELGNRIRFRAPEKLDLEDDTRVFSDLRSEGIFLDGIVPRGFFVCRKSVHDELRTYVNDLREEFDHAVKHLFGAARAGALASAEAKLVSEMLVPHLAAAEMRKAWGMLRWGKLRSWADFVVCWGACQRFAGEVDAFLTLSTRLLAKVRHSGLQRYLDRHAERRAIACHDMRGSILVGTDIDDYYSILRTLGAPTYLLVSPKEIDDAGVEFKSAGNPRCQYNSEGKLVFAVQRDLPELYYPPEDVEWQMVEVYARSYMKRPTPAKPSELKQKLEKKLGNVAKEAERQRELHEGKQERRAQKFSANHESMKTSHARYVFFTKNIPAFQRWFDLQGKPRPDYIAPVIACYRSAEEAAMCGDRIIFPTKLQQSLFTFLPPLHLFTDLKDPRRLDKFMMNLVILFPLLLRLVALSRRPGTSVKRFGTWDWKRILATTWDEGKFWVSAPEPEAEDGEIAEARPAKKQKKNRREQGLPHAVAETIFGAEEAERLLAHPEERPAFGRLPCGHEATPENMKVQNTQGDGMEGDKILYSGILHALNQWLQLQWLPNLMKPVDLAASNIPEVKDIHGSHFTPDYVNIDKHNNGDIPRVIKRIVLGGKPFDDEQGFWPTPWSAEEAALERNERRAWLKDMKNLLVGAALSREVDRDMQGDSSWRYSTAELRHVNMQHLSDFGMDAMERHLWSRYVLTSVKAGQVPPEFQQMARGHAHLCAKCRAEVGFMREDDLDNEYDEDDYQLAD